MGLEGHGNFFFEEHGGWDSWGRDEMSEADFATGIRTAFKTVYSFFFLVSFLPPSISNVDRATAVRFIVPSTATLRGRSSLLSPKEP